MSHVGCGEARTASIEATYRNAKDEWWMRYAYPPYKRPCCPELLRSYGCPGCTIAEDRG